MKDENLIILLENPIRGEHIIIHWTIKSNSTTTDKKTNSHTQTVDRREPKVEISIVFPHCADSMSASFFSSGCIIVVVVDFFFVYVSG